MSDTNDYRCDSARLRGFLLRIAAMRIVLDARYKTRKRLHTSIQLPRLFQWKQIKNLCHISISPGDLLITVEDTGSSVDPRHAACIFEPFLQPNPTAWA
jgi:hypothetical protein